MQFSIARNKLQIGNWIFFSRFKQGTCSNNLVMHEFRSNIFSARYQCLIVFVLCFFFVLMSKSDDLTPDFFSISSVKFGESFVRSKVLVQKSLRYFYFL